jgi:hypothetical protein
LTPSSFECSCEGSDFNSSFNDGFWDGEVIPEVEFTCPDEFQVGNQWARAHWIPNENRQNRRRWPDHQERSTLSRVEA